ncbi:MAG: tRNA (adenosine(37)-N6)-threonylcarbamoyltransferase complex ATPase subunit type 1 TsaE [Verrucomicrobia bacterium]|nr:tRNA (adenosine(37)-N6)-threonylcarbamoyltransferase complex ATPase subunit type 1 TsaE [Verrucomicrobiota bacterium]
MGLYYASSIEETHSIACSIAKELKPGDILAFFGQLGAGKTTFIKAIAKEIVGISEHAVSSPTFQYLNIYQGEPPLYHFDLYRLRGAEDFLDMGFDECLEQHGICCIEWAERIHAILPPKTISISMTHVGDNIRTIEVSK